MSTHAELVNAVKEIKEVAGLDIKNPQFTKSDKLVEILNQFKAENDDLTDLTEETRKVLEEIGTDENNLEAAEAADDEEPPVQDAENESDQPQQVDLTSREALNKAAQDMNEVMGLEPGIDINLDDASFMKAFVKASKMATGTDNFTEFTWQVLKANDLGPERVLSKPIKAKADKKEKEKKEPKPKKEKAPKGPGVIATIKGFLVERHEQDEPFDRYEILKVLTKTFPERPEDSLMATIRTQVPGRLSKESGFSFEPCEKKGSFKVIGIPEK